MATMINDSFAYAVPAQADVKRSAVETTRRPSFVQRFWAAMKASREAQARREIARHAHLIAGLSQSRIDRNDLPF